MGHEYAGIVEEVGADVQTIKPGQFVVGSFWATDNTCEICRAGPTSPPRTSSRACCRPPTSLAPVGSAPQRGDAGVTAIKELTNGLGAHSVVEAVGTQESMMQAIHATRPGGHVGFVGVAHGVAVDGIDLLPLGEAAAAYRAMDQRDAIKVLLRP